MTAHQRWGLTGTLIWSLAVIAGFFAIQIVVSVLYVAATSQHAPVSDLEQEFGRIQYNSDLLSIATYTTTILCVLAILAIIRLKRGAVIRDYLPLVLPPGRMLLRWLLYLLIFIAVSDTISIVLRQPIVPEFLEQVYLWPGNKFMLFGALLIAAPIFEELMFRGFMISGLTLTRVGPAGAVLISALIWAVIHLQYDAYQIITIFALGIFLGAARIKTGSVATTILLHAAANAVAVLETVIKISATPF